LKDRLGQVLIGENTYLAYQHQGLDAPANSEIAADFSFRMPIFPKGDYSIDIAVASGSQTQHVQHHWLHDALLFRSESTSVSTGLVGVPMKTELSVHVEQLAQ
jgi:lipopolysaccharide transport system ATP-binding protein